MTPMDETAASPAPALPESGVDVLASAMANGNASILLDVQRECIALRQVVNGFLACPEIAECAAEDKAPETEALERRARALATPAPASAPAPVDAGGLAAEPVAWRWRYEPGMPWHLTDHPKAVPTAEHWPLCEVEPLYDASALAAAAEREKELLRLATEHLQARHFAEAKAHNSHLAVIEERKLADAAAEREAALVRGLEIARGILSDELQLSYDKLMEALGNPAKLRLFYAEKRIQGQRDELKRLSLRVQAAEREKAAALGLVEGHAAIISQLEARATAAEAERDEHAGFCAEAIEQRSAAEAERDRMRVLLVQAKDRIALNAADLSMHSADYLLVSRICEAIRKETTE